MFARYYNSATGRFLSPDPSGLDYADQANPQSLNLYGYVMNNPITLVDPTGTHWDCSNVLGDDGRPKHVKCDWVDDGYVFQGLLLMQMTNEKNAAQLQQGQSSGSTAAAAKPAPTKQPAPARSPLPNCYALAAQTAVDDLNPFNPGPFSLFEPTQAALGAAAVGQAQRAALYGAANGMRYRATKLTVRSMLKTSTKLSGLAKAMPLISLDLALVDAIHTELTQPCTVQ